ncbi:hypothetical protein AVEN_56101-1 [Araneus ventricosus]|uniref:Uncharacterized protein n=1 Tax=Araneus ventricosus TaxID=182803 RepID=A0A4Y2KH46_ARAVE|nr:hypothetical protein AVEN_56101-1 [Araneus ventricosus]
MVLNNCTKEIDKPLERAHDFHSNEDVPIFKGRDTPGSAVEASSGSSLWARIVWNRVTVVLSVLKHSFERVHDQVHGGVNPSGADLTKNMDATGESSVCSLVHRDKVRYYATTTPASRDKDLRFAVWKDVRRFSVR